MGVPREVGLKFQKIGINGKIPFDHSCSGPVSPSLEMECNIVDPQASKYNINVLSDKQLKYLQHYCSGALVDSVKIHLSYGKCGHDCASEQLARHWKVTLEQLQLYLLNNLQCTRRYTLNVVAGSF